MKKCKSCQEEIDDKAKKCPKCQSDQRIWFAKHPIWTVIIALVIIGMIGSAINGAGSDTTGSNNDSQTTPTPTPEAMKINVKTLGDAFNDNQVAAESEWGGKFVEFSAEIGNITDSSISFQKVDSKEFSITQIACRLSDKNQALNIKNGQTITVQGVVGDQTIGVIELKDCKIVN